MIKPSTFTGFDVSDNSAKRTTSGGLNPWDNKRYLNIWIFNITNGSSSGEILGYAYNPALATNVLGDANLMGVCVDYRAFGKGQASHSLLLRMRIEAELWFTNWDIILP